MEDRYKHQLEALSVAENQALEAKRQANAAQRSALQQVLLANQTVELQGTESKRRLEAMEKANQTSVQRWQEMLVKQHTVSRISIVGKHLKLLQFSWPSKMSTRHWIPVKTEKNENRISACHLSSK